MPALVGHEAIPMGHASFGDHHINMSNCGNLQTYQATATFLPKLNDWNHIAVMWDRDGIGGGSETVRLYVNGLQVAAIQNNLWGSGFNVNHADIAESRLGFVQPKGRQFDRRWLFP